jgi:cytochrome c biogenesis protein CcdA
LPLLGGAIGLASQGGFSMTAGVQMMFFGLGTVTPLLAIAYGARSMIDRNRGRFIKLGQYAKPAFGLILLLAGVVVVSGLDNEIMAIAERVMPDWLSRWTTSV